MHLRVVTSFHIRRNEEQKQAKISNIYYYQTTLKQKMLNTRKLIQTFTMYFILFAPNWHHCHLRSPVRPSSLRAVVSASGKPRSSCLRLIYRDITCDSDTRYPGNVNTLILLSSLLEPPTSKQIWKHLFIHVLLRSPPARTTRTKTTDSRDALLAVKIYPKTLTTYPISFWLRLCSHILNIAKIVLHTTNSTPS